MTSESKPTITVFEVFERTSDSGRCLARDMRVRWALEEVGQPYEVRPVPFTAMKEFEHSACCAGCADRNRSKNTPNLAACVAHAERRPAIKRTFEVQRAFFDGVAAV